jgi:hypothetical protein
MGDKPLFNNMFIAEYIKNNKLVMPKQIIFPDSKPPKNPTPKPSRKVDLKITSSPYWGEIVFKINTKDFDNVKIKYEHNNKTIEDNIETDEYIIKKLNTIWEYDFIFTAENENKKYEKIIKSKINSRCAPEPPDFIVKDSTHDIEINFVNTIDNGLPIKNILLFKDNDKSPFERKPYNNQIKLDTKIHKRTKLIVKFENEVGCSDG